MTTFVGSIQKGYNYSKDIPMSCCQAYIQLIIFNISGMACELFIQLNVLIVFDALILGLIYLFLTSGYSANASKVFKYALYQSSWSDQSLEKMLFLCRISGSEFNYHLASTNIHAR